VRSQVRSVGYSALIARNRFLDPEIATFTLKKVVRANRQSHVCTCGVKSVMEGRQELASRKAGIVALVVNHVDFNCRFQSSLCATDYQFLCLSTASGYNTNEPI
jgi:hypothetical protein